MANSHRRNVLVTSCLKTPVDPNTKAPLASYERGRASASGRLDNRDYEKELEYQDSESDFCEEDCVGKTSPHMRNGYTRGRPDLSEIFFSNEEYYSKLEELKKTHLSTMAKIAKQAAEKRYIEALHGSDVTEDFLSSKVGKSASDCKASVSSDSKQSNQEDADYKPVRYRKIFLDDEDIDDPAESKGRKKEESDMASLNQDDEDHSPDDYHGIDCSYSDGSFSEDVEKYSDNSEHEADVRQQKMKEEQLYRSIKIQMRAQEMLNSASLPPSMLTRRPSERKKTKDDSTAAEAARQPQINKEVPDFKASHKRFQKQLERRKEVKPITACEPFQLKTSQISCHRERILADIEKDRSSPRMLRWPYISPGSARTPSSSLCSSLSGSMELLPAKATDATKKRHEANCFLADQYTLFLLKSTPLNLPLPTTTIISLSRKVLEQRKKAEEEEQRWRDKQKQREKKLQRVVLKRAQANDPHQALSQIYQGKLKEFRKQDLQRKKEYKQEIRNMCERVKGRPLLLEQVAQRIAKQAAEKRYIEALHGSDVTEDFLSSKVGKSASDCKASVSSDSKQSNQEDADYKPVRYRKIFLDDEDIDDPAESKGRKKEESDMASLNQDDEDHSPDDYHGIDCSYSDGSFSEDVEKYSDNSEHEADVRQQKVGE
uniref:Protein FAM161A n=3 Tax=Nothobranchius TaxID=28779 RepID=A0A1A8S6I1_9TELE